MKHLKKYYGIYIFAAIVASIAAYWWFFKRAKKCKIYKIPKETLREERKILEKLSREEVEKYYESLSPYMGQESFEDEKFAYITDEGLFKIFEAFFAKANLKIKRECATEEEFTKVKETIAKAKEATKNKGVPVITGSAQIPQGN